MSPEALEALRGTQRAEGQSSIERARQAPGIIEVLRGILPRNPLEALAHFDAAFALNPLRPTWYRNGHARALLCLERFDDSLAAIERLLEIEPDFHQGWLYRAYIFQRLGRTEDARGAMTRASQLAPMLRLHHIPQFFLLDDPEMLERFAEVLGAAGLPE